MLDEQSQWAQVNAAFSKQSTHFDEDDFSNPVLQHWRQRIYNHVEQFLKPRSRILEINAGTGIDAVHFASQGHFVHATDLSDGMIAKIKEKISANALSKNITVQQVSFARLNEVQGKFDHVFSNFGGLNCIDDLTEVTRHLRPLLSDNAFVTGVIMPRVCPWEWSWLLKGQFKNSFRRFAKSGTLAKLEDETFLTYYHSLAEIERAFEADFIIKKSEGLGIFSPPPSAINFVKKFPDLSRSLERTDEMLRSQWPFNRWGDHVIVTFGVK